MRLTPKKRNFSEFQKSMEANVDQNGDNPEIQADDPAKKKTTVH